MDSVPRESFGCIRDSIWVNQPGPCKSTLIDIIDQLPSDPFGMNNCSNVNISKAFWIEDMMANYTCERLIDGHVGSGFSHQISTRFLEKSPFLQPYTTRFVDEEIPEYMDCTSQDSLQTMPSTNVICDHFSSDFLQNVTEIDMHPHEQVSMNYSDAFPAKILLDGRIAEAQTTDMLPCNAERHFKAIHCDSSDCEALNEGLQFEVSNSTGGSEGNEVVLYEKNHGGAEEHGGPPHEGLFFALGHLGVEDLLAVEKVCKSLHIAVQTDPLLWRCLHINHPLNIKLTDDALLQLTQRAEGRLQCLDLVGCFRITDSGLDRVIQNNPGITKLSLPGCLKLTVKGVVNSLKLVKIPSMPPMKHLRLGGIFGGTRSHYEDLKLLVGMDKFQHGSRRPRFYHISDSSSSCDYESVIDIEVCPRCQDLRLVYDCPSDDCQGRASDPCRACELCISRCASCGRCIIDVEYEETFCLDFICVDCWVHFMRREKEEREEELDKVADPKKLLQLLEEIPRPHLEL